MQQDHLWLWSVLPTFEVCLKALDSSWWHCGEVVESLEGGGSPEVLRGARVCFEKDWDPVGPFSAAPCRLLHCFSAPGRPAFCAATIAEATGPGDHHGLRTLKPGTKINLFLLGWPTAVLEWWKPGYPRRWRNLKVKESRKRREWS